MKVHRCKNVLRLALWIIIFFFSNSIRAQKSDFRAPSYPLITHDPYFSIWMNHQNPTLCEASHWTQKTMPIHCMIRIDGEVYRLMGESPAFVPAAKLKNTELTATQTIYHFKQNGLNIQLKFCSPLLLDNLDLVSRPLSYITWEFESVDGKSHDAEVYFDISGYAAIHHKGQTVQWENTELNGLCMLKMGTQEQPVLKRKGDDVRIDWGHLYLAGHKSIIKTTYIGRSELAMDAFASDSSMPDEKIADQDLRFVNYQPVLSAVIPAKVMSGQMLQKMLMVAYDDVFSVEYFGQPLEGYWKKKFNNVQDLFITATEEYPEIIKKCNDFDKTLHRKASELGGEKYAVICDLAYRQTMAAHKIVKDDKGQVLCFSKENFSNGSMGTVDVFYPAAPYFLYLNVDLMKAQTTPIFDYAESGKWPWPYAPHDIGKYPIGNGQTYGGGELTEDRQMPVEECGNMLILVAAIAKVEGHAHYAERYWKTISKWAEYLKEKGFDPENQLCTDDFAGHLAHNANLSVKAIMGVASYAMLCKMLNKPEEEQQYTNLSLKMVESWLKAAKDVQHYRLAFDKPGSWSQKYNMVWDDILGFNLFDEDVENEEIRFYLKNQNRYGLPLDSRETYTKLDWILWTASLANNRSEFEQLIDPVYAFLNESPNRVPMSDWYWTKSGEIRGFIARSVVGGVYMELLKDKLNNR